MSDYIDRQAAIDAIGSYILSFTAIDRNYYEGLRDAKRLLNDIPPAEVERKTGEWIEDAKTYYEQLNERGLGVDEYTPYFVDDIACSVCLAKYSTIDNETQFFKYCPNCGAKMGAISASPENGREVEGEEA